VEDSTVDVCIVGAGAAGLAAGVFAGEEAAETGIPCRIHLLDGAKTIGAKILVSGGGRCNITHDVVTASDFFGNRRIIKNILAAFPVQATIAWFASMGVDLKREETGKLFPVTDKARTVVAALLDRCRELGAVVCPDHRVTDIVPLNGPGSGFFIHHTRGTLYAKTVILATGGCSLPKTGSDGFGYELARRLGHRVSKISQALAPLILVESFFHKDLSGISQDVEITTLINGSVVDQRRGSLLWTHFGISGPVVMDVSRFWTSARDRGEQAELYVNFLPTKTQESARQWFMDQATVAPRRSLVKTLAQLEAERFAESFCRHMRISGHTAIAQVPKHDRDRLLAALLRFPLPVQQDRGWNYAEVTAGGVPLEEVNFRTMESKLVPGLYLAGEILDCDGRIGGFNFQWAWATGWLAGRASASSHAR